MRAESQNPRLVESDDGELLALHDFGGTGPALLLSHGNGLNAGMWQGALPSLTQRFSVFGLDLRGHGMSRSARPDYSVARSSFAGDVLRVIEALGEPVYYAAHSLGGAAAVYAALEAPDAFAKLWLFEPVAIPLDFTLPGGPSHLIETSRRRRMEFESADEAFANFSSKPPFASCDASSVRGYVDLGTRPLPDGGVRLSCEGEDEARVFESGEPIDFDRLDTITVPTLIAAGPAVDGPHAIPAAVAPLIAEALPAGRLEVYPDLSHFGPMEDPQQMADSIAAHFDSETS